VLSGSNEANSPRSITTTGASINHCQPSSATHQQCKSDTHSTSVEVQAAATTADSDAQTDHWQAQQHASTTAAQTTNGACRHSQTPPDDRLAQLEADNARLTAENAQLRGDAAHAANQKTCADTLLSHAQSKIAALTQQVQEARDETDALMGSAQAMLDKAANDTAALDAVLQQERRYNADLSDQLQQQERAADTLTLRLRRAREREVDALIQLKKHELSLSFNAAAVEHNQLQHNFNDATSRVAALAMERQRLEVQLGRQETRIEKLLMTRRSRWPAGRGPSTEARPRRG